MIIKIAGISNESIVDGPGFRYTIFVQGCPHHCDGCHNPETHDFNGGREVDVKELVTEMLNNPLLDGLTLSGGEPFCQPAACTEIARAAHQAGLNVWCYTGYTLEYLQACGMSDINELLCEVDVLVDGPFIKSEKSLNIGFRGSKNQRIIKLNGGTKDEKT